MTRATRSSTSNVSTIDFANTDGLRVDADSADRSSPPSTSRVVGGTARGVARGCGSSLAPIPDVRRLHDDNDGGTEVRATVRGDASRAVPSTIPGVPPTLPRSATDDTRCATAVLMGSPAADAAGTEATSLDSEGERLNNAHHDWEERDGASDIEAEHTEEEIPELAARIRNIAAGMTSLDAVNIKTVFERRAPVMRSSPHFLWEAEQRTG